MAETSFTLARTTGGLQARRRRAARPAPPALLLCAVAVAVLALGPLGALVIQASSAGLARLEQLLLRPLVGELLLNTVLVTAVGTAAATGLGLGVAWCVERTRLPGGRVLGVLAGLPITVPAFIASYSWVSITPAVQGFAGATLIVTLAYYPLVYLPVAATLRGMDPALEESARALGLGPFRTFLRVTLPHTRPALLGGALVVAVHLLAEFGAFSLLRFRTFTTAIYDEYRLSFSGPSAALLSTVLISMCVVLLLIELRVRGRALYTRSGAGATRPMARIRPGRLATLAVLLAFGILLGAALGVPLVTIGYWLARSSASVQVGPLMTAAATSLGLAVGAAILTCALALPVAVLVVRYPSRLATLLERSTYIAHSLPGIAIALALVVVAIRYVRPVYQSVPLLLLAYAILFLPLAQVAVRAALAQISPGTEEIARSLGCGPLTTLRRVTLPLLARGLGSGAALVLLFTVTELPATLLLAPIGTVTLATEVWSSIRSLTYGAAAPPAALMIVLSAVPTYLLTRKLSAIGAEAR